jgi:hypothetical protein
MNASESMAASLLNQPLSLTTGTNMIATSTTSPISVDQPPQWDAVAVYGFVFGLLAVLLAVPGTYLAIVALRRHRQREPRSCESDSSKK